MKQVLTTFFLFLTLTYTSFAATDDFTIRLVVIDDITPPTTPILDSVLPIGATQIDIAWQASTDNYQLGGYVLFRDGVAIATTTLLSYNDTGLSPLTFYSYELYAFDVLGNISSTSNALGTTTLALPVTVPEINTGSEQSTQTTILRSFSIETTGTTANLAWETNLPSRYSVRWGRTDAYQDGYVVSEIFKREQRTTITGLEPGVTYFYEVTGLTLAGRPLVLKTGQFTTNQPVQATTVPNVSRLVAVVEGSGVRMSYMVPTVVPPLKVRVVRNHLGFPADPYDGAVVYEGYATTVLDLEAFAAYDRQFYTVFLINAEGVVSSGAVVVVERPDVGTPTGPEGGAGESDLGGGLMPPIEVTPPEVVLFGFDPEAISLLQNDFAHTFLTTNIQLWATEPLTIRIPYQAVPEYLKAIIVTLTDPTDSRMQYSFLLKIRPDKTAYEAVIAPLGVVGTALIRVEIFDFERSLVGRYQVPVSFVTTSTSPRVFFPDALVATFIETRLYTLGFILGMVALFFIIWFRRGRTEDNV